MRLKAVSVLLAAACGILLGGCSAGFSDSALLHPPKTTGTEAKIEKLIERTAGGSYLLKYPQSGQYRSAIITEDINNDKKDEAIAFYRTEGDDPKTHMLVMYDDGKELKISCDYATDYADVECVTFADYDFDGVPEIFVGFSTYTAGINELKIFDCSKDASKVSEVDFKELYSGFTTGDYDRDGGSELLLFTLKTADTEAEARLFDYDKNVLYELSSCDMDRSVTRYESITSGLLGEQTMGVAVDGFKENLYNSQVVFYDSDSMTLKNYPYTTSKKRNPTRRSFDIHSGDIDKDGFVEIPKVSDTLNVGTEDEAVAPEINWCTMDTDAVKLKDDIRCVSNFEYGYYFILPENFEGTTVATLSKDNRTLRIYALYGKEKGDLIMTIKVFDVGAADKMSGFKTLESHNQYSYTYKIDENTPIYISDDSIKENFSINDIT